MSFVEQFPGRRYITIESYKRSGEPKDTPVQSLERNGVLYVRTSPTSWKVRRIAGNPRVRIANSDRRGRPEGEWIEGQAQILEGDERTQALDIFRKDYGTLGYAVVSLVGRLRGLGGMSAVISIRTKPASEQRPASPNRT